MANFIKPYNDDPFVGHLATPITSSAVTRAILQNLPAYRFGLTPLLRGLEIGFNIFLQNYNLSRIFFEFEIIWIFAKRRQKDSIHFRN